MYLSLHENHFSLITNLDKYYKCYESRQCQKLWKGAWETNRHEHTCNQVTKKKFVGGSYQPEATVFELLEHKGSVSVPIVKQFLTINEKWVLVKFMKALGTFCV